MLKIDDGINIDKILDYYEFLRWRNLFRILGDFC